MCVCAVLCVCGASRGRACVPVRVRVCHRRGADTIKGHATRMVEDQERRARKEQRRARLMEKRGNSFRGPSGGGSFASPRSAGAGASPGLSPHPPGSFTHTRRTSSVSASRKDRFLKRGQSSKLPGPTTPRSRRR